MSGNMSSPQMRVEQLWEQAVLCTLLQRSEVILCWLPLLYLYLFEGKSPYDLKMYFRANCLLQQ